MSTSHYSGRDYTRAEAGKPAATTQHAAHMASMRAVAPDWEDPLSGVVATCGDTRLHPSVKIRLLIECAWLSMLSVLLLAFDAAGVVYFWGEPEAWLFAALAAPAWVLAMACLERIRRF